MSEIGGTQSTAGPSTNNNIAVYVLCVIIGAVVGVLITLTATGGFGSLMSGGGGGGDPVVATYNGKSVRASEALGNVKGRLFELDQEQFRTKEQAINEFVDNKLLDAEAKKQNMTVDQLVEKESGGPATDVSEKDIKEFLTSKGLSLDDPRIKQDDVKEYLKYRSKFDKKQGYVAKLRASSNVKITLKEPESPRISVATEGFPTWGNAKAPVTIVEFSDFQCPFCSRAIPVLDRIKQEYGPDKVKIVFIDMPLPNHNRAMPAALAAHCANDQGKFWEYHNALFTNQAKLEDGDLKTYAKTVGLDEAKFKDCFDNKKFKDAIDRARREGERVGIQATPSFVINGTLLQGAQPFERFKERIDRATRG